MGGGERGGDGRRGERRRWEESRLKVRERRVNRVCRVKARKE
jgi:hypothetical protein